MHRSITISEPDFNSSLVINIVNYYIPIHLQINTCKICDIKQTISLMHNDFVMDSGTRKVQHLPFWMNLRKRKFLILDKPKVERKGRAFVSLS